MQGMSQPVHSSDRVPRNQMTHRAGIPRSNSVGQNSLTASATASVSLSPEEKYVRQRFYSGGKPPTDKPVHHVKGQSVEELLRDLDISDTRTGKAG